MGRLTHVGLVLGWVALLGLTGCQVLSASSPLDRGLFQLADSNQLTPRKLGLIVNQRDPLSLEIAEYYQVRRGIPPENVVRVEFDPTQTVLSVEAFQGIWEMVQAQTPESVQAYALTWAQPYRVDCMSITAAFTFGFDQSFCAQGCQATAVSPYFNSAHANPADTLNIRPTMALAATSDQAARGLIERGIAADYLAPSGTAYLMNTRDAARNVRSHTYAEIQTQLGPWFNLQVINDNQITGRFDVMFYFTGLAQVPAIATNQYHPGAVADHLTSLGGQLTDSTQMSSLRWLEAGATGSYGTVVEPCNFPQKFPHPGVLMAHYLNGDTLIEAYWKSVLMPGQGIFIGEPLARPFPGTKP
jgi:uncharacterized protein (TIGR03790 family)